MQLALPLHTLQPYALICQYMAPLTPRVPLLFALVRRLIVSSAALLASLILVNSKTLVQARLLPVILSVTTLSMALVQVQSRRVAILHCPLAGLLAQFPGLSSLFLSLYHWVAVSSFRHKAMHCIAAPLRVCPSSCFDVVNEEADARENVVVADGHANVRASAGMTNDNASDNDTDDGDFDGNLGKILGASSMATPSLDPDLAFGAVNSNIDLARTNLLSIPSPLPHLLPSPPPSTAG